MPKLLLLFFTGFLGLTGVSVRAPGLKTLDNKFKDLSQEQSNIAVVFLSPECPLCNNYALTLNQLSVSYKKKGIQLIGIIPGKNFMMKDIREFIRVNQIRFEILLDPEKQFADWCKATVTPEAFLLNRKMEIVYSGRIDNWAYEVGRKRKVITTHELEDAMQSLSSGSPIGVQRTKAVGCFIE